MFYLLDEFRVLTDLGVAFLVNILEAISFDVVLDEGGESNLVTFRIFFLEHLHVFGNVVTEDTFEVSRGIIFVVLGRK